MLRCTGGRPQRGGQAQRGCEACPANAAVSIRDGTHRGHGDQRADAGLCRPKLSGGHIRRSPKQNTCPKPLTGDRCVYEPAGDQPGESPKQLGDSLKEFLRVLPYQVRARTT